MGQSTLDDWQWVLDINLKGVILGCHAMVDWLKSNPAPAYVLNIASAAAMFCAPGMAAYNVSKAGVVALSHSLYMELKAHGVGVTVACPWFIQTELLKQGRFATDGQRTFAERAMARARVTPEEFARTALSATFRGQMTVIPGRRPRLALFLRRMMPQTFANLVCWQIRRMSAKDGGPQSETAPG